MALPHHDAAHGDKAKRADAKLFRAEDCRDHNVTARLQAAISAQLDTMAKAVERQYLIGFGKAHFPWRTGIFDTGKRARTRSADIARNEDDVGMRFRDTRRNRADPGCAHQLDANPRARVDLFQVVDQLREILDRIDVMMWGRGDQRHARGRMAQARDHLGHLEAGKLPAFAGLCPLSNLDLNFLAGTQIFGGDTKSARCNLLDHAVGIVAILIGFEALAIFAPFARDSFCPDTVHGDGKCFMRLRRKRPQRHTRCDEALADLGYRLDLVERYARAGVIEFHKVAQIDWRQFAHTGGKLQVGRIAVLCDRALQQVHEACRIGMRFAILALLVETANGQARHGAVKGLGMAFGCIDEQRMIAFARYLVWHAGEEIIGQCATKADCFEIITAAIAGDDCDPHLRHDLEQAFVDRGAIIFDSRRQGH